MPLIKKLRTSTKKNIKRKSVKRKSVKRKSVKRKSVKRKSVKRKSVKRKSASKDQSKVKECIKRKRRSRVIRRSPKCSIDKCYSAWRRATKC